MIKPLFASLEKNIRKKVKEISELQWMEIMEESQELYELKVQIENKVNLKDLIKNKMKGLSASAKFQDLDREIDVLVPKLTSVLLETFSEPDFVQSLLLFNDKLNCKTQYSVDDLFIQLTSFTDKVVQNKKNGYKGYSVKFTQINTQKEQKVADKYYIELEVAITGLDWGSIKKEET